MAAYYLRGACASAFFAAGQGRLRCFKLCSLLGRVCLSLCIVAYPAATAAAVRMLDCVEVAVPQTPATSNALDGAPDISQQATAQKLIILSVLRTNPYFVCWSGSHKEAGVLAAAAITFFVLGFPLSVLAWLVCPAIFRRKQGSGSDAPRVPKFRSQHSWRRAADRTCTRCAPRGEPDQLFAPVVSDFLPVAWYTKFIDLTLLLLLSVLRALLPSPETVEAVALKAGLAAAAALAVAAHVVLFRPYEFVERWKGPVRVLLLLVSACSSILNGASTAVQRGWAAPPSLPESVTASSYLLLALWGVALIVLFAGEEGRGEGISPSLSPRSAPLRRLRLRAVGGGGAGGKGLPRRPGSGQGGGGRRRGSAGGAHWHSRRRRGQARSVGRVGCARGCDQCRRSRGAGRRGSGSSGPRLQRRKGLWRQRGAVRVHCQRCEAQRRPHAHGLP